MRNSAVRMWPASHYSLGHLLSLSLFTPTPTYLATEAPSPLPSKNRVMLRDIRYLFKKRGDERKSKT